MWTHGASEHTLVPAEWVKWEWSSVWGSQWHSWVQLRACIPRVPGDVPECLACARKVQGTQNDQRLIESSDDEWNEIIKAETPFYYVDSPRRNCVRVYASHKAWIWKSSIWSAGCENGWVVNKPRANSIIAWRAAEVRCFECRNLSSPVLALIAQNTESVIPSRFNQNPVSWMVTQSIHVKRELNVYTLW